jgi:hypothetical protein
MLAHQDLEEILGTHSDGVICKLHEIATVRMLIASAYENGDKPR